MSGSEVAGTRLSRLHVCFVCTGNICRSPLAEQVLRRHLAEAGLAHQVLVSSAGTGGWHVGQAADRRTEAVLATHGYPHDHTAAQVGPEHLSAELLVALDSGHARELLALGADPDQVRLLRSFDPDAESSDVTDPYYGPDRGFELVLEQVEAAVPGLLDWVRKSR